MVGTIQSTRKPAVQPGLFQSMASCMNRTFVVQMKAFQRNKPQSTIKQIRQPFFYRTGCRTSQIAETVTVSLPESESADPQSIHESAGLFSRIMEYGRCRFVSVRNILQQLDGSEVTVLRNHVVHPHTAVLLRQYLCLAVKSLLLQQPPQYREVARIEETRTFFTKLPVGTYIRLLFLIIRRIPPATRKAIPPTSRTGPDAEEESSTFDEKNRRHSPTAQKGGKE